MAAGTYQTPPRQNNPAATPSNQATPDAEKPQIGHIVITSNSDKFSPLHLPAPVSGVQRPAPKPFSPNNAETSAPVALP
eukprot:scaffold651744_cov46-Prasinocladus_malaysianus.AAC.1